MAKCLSLRQPYAELIVSGRKTIELRKWNTRFRGHRALIIERCQKCGRLIDDGNLMYHADVRHNDMTSCQEDLLYESMP